MPATVYTVHVRLWAHAHAPPSWQAGTMTMPIVPAPDKKEKAADTTRLREFLALPSLGPTPTGPRPIPSQTPHSTHKQRAMPPRVRPVAVEETTAEEVMIGAEMTIGGEITTDAVEATTGAVERTGTMDIVIM